MKTGIYYGWAQVVVKRNRPEVISPSSSSETPARSSGNVEATGSEKDRSVMVESASSSTTSLATQCRATVYPMVMSLGWNPYYRNEKQSAEVHIMHDFHRDFYGDELRIVVLGYIRPEFDYTTLGKLPLAHSLFPRLRGSAFVLAESLGRSMREREREPRTSDRSSLSILTKVLSHPRH